LSNNIRNVSYYDLLEAKESFTCQECMRMIKIKQIFFRTYDRFGKFKYLCTECIQIWLKNEIEQLNNKILDLKNIEGKASMLANQYKERKEKQNEKETINSN